MTEPKPTGATPARERLTNLCLSRRCGESLTLIMPDGSRVTLAVIDLGRGKVRICTTAPRDVTIMRTELLTRGAES